MNIISGEPDHDGDIVGDVGVVISGNTGPIHLGTGDIHIGTTVVGDGVTIVAGNNSKGVRKSFGGGKK
jgi:hypothetical protein